jgi:hypothetical protein
MNIANRRCDARVTHYFLNVLRACAALRRPRAERMTARAVEWYVWDTCVTQSRPPSGLDVSDRLACLGILKQVPVRTGRSFESF